MILGNYPFIIYEVFKPNIYQEMGGFHGYLIFLKRKQPAVKGIGIEAPIVSMFNSETKQPYYRPNPAFDRYDGDIYYSIALDCCQDIFDKALKALKEFVKELVFD